MSLPPISKDMSFILSLKKTSLSVLTVIGDSAGKVTPFRAQ
jgi:hypothetical protein